MTDENQEYAVVEAELDNLTKVTLKIPKHLDIANLSGLLQRLQRLIKVFPEQLFNNSGKRSYVKHNQIEKNQTHKRKVRTSKYFFANSKDELLKFKEQFHNANHEQKKQIARNINAPNIDALRVALTNASKKFLINQNSSKVAKHFHKWTADDELYLINEFKTGFQKNLSIEEISKIFSEKNLGITQRAVKNRYFKLKTEGRIQK